MRNAVQHKSLMEVIQRRKAILDNLLPPRVQQEAPKQEAVTPRKKQKRQHSPDTEELERILQCTPPASNVDQELEKLERQQGVSVAPEGVWFMALGKMYVHKALINSPDGGPTTYLPVCKAKQKHTRPSAEKDVWWQGEYSRYSETGCWMCPHHQCNM
jgi:hypothetical protein